MMKSLLGIERRTGGRGMQSVDVLQFGADILQSDVTFRRTLDSGVEFAIRDSSDSVKIEHWYDVAANRIERVVFGDGMGRMRRHDQQSANDASYMEQLDWRDVA
jgi:hypothetical protein